MAHTADGLPHVWIHFKSPKCVAHPEAGGESAPLGPTCLPDGAYAAGDYSKCCHSQFHSDGHGHYICGN